MQTIKVTSLIFSDLDYQVPSTVEEYNALAPKRQNPILEDAVDNIIKHKVLGQFRNKFLDFVEEKFKDVEGSARQNFGTEKTPKWEPDVPYITRLVALVLKSRGLDPTTQGNVDALASELRVDAQRILSEQKFNVAEREPSTGGGPAVAKTYLEWAGQAIDGGKAERLLSLLNSANGTTVALTGDREKDIDLLAKAIAANEKRKRDAQLAAAKAEYGLDAPAV